MDLEEINQGLADAVSGISGLRSAPWLPAAVNDPPLFCPWDLDYVPHQSFANALTQMNYTCVLLCSRGDQDAGRVQLAAFLPPTGAMSVKAALEADRTLGGVCKTLQVDRVHRVNALIAIGGVDYYSAQFDLRVWAA